MNSPVLASSQPLLWKNSTFSLPKKPSALELSGERPFLDIGRTMPCSSQMAIQQGQRKLAASDRTEKRQHPPVWSLRFFGIEHNSFSVADAKAELIKRGMIHPGHPVFG